MANTTNFNWETPDDTDLVKDGAAAIRTLGSSIDTSFVDLKGGTTGQILSKASNTDLDYTWIANDQGDITEVSAGTGISVASGTGPVPVVTNTVATTFDAKGDLVVGTGADTFAKLTVGTNGYTLVADSVETTGLKWAAPASGATTVGCVVYSSAAQTINNNTSTKVNYDTELFDTNGFHSTSVNNSRITIPSGQDGYYYVFAFGQFVDNATGFRQIDIWKNNSSSGRPARGATSAVSSAAVIYASGIIYLVATDYIEAVVTQNSGGNLDFYGDAAATGRFGCFRIGS